MHQGHEVKRVISRKFSANRTNKLDTATAGSPIPMHDDFDLDDNEFEQLVNQQYPDQAALPEQVTLDDEYSTDTTSYADFDSDELEAMYRFADSGYMSSPNKGDALPAQGNILTSSTPQPLELAANQQWAPSSATATEPDTWFLFDDDMDEELIALVQKVETNALETNALESRGPTTKTQPDIAMSRNSSSDPQLDLDAASTRPQRAHMSSSSLPVQPLPDPTSDRAADHSMGKPRSIVRNPFPEQIKDRSPVLGVSTNSILRTCFSVSVALDTGCHAVRNGKNIVLELYARVISSSREAGTAKQHFVFADLSRNIPPYIEGTYEGWSGVEKWDENSAHFLDTTEKNSRICRCVGSMMREKAKWKMVIQSIREASWEDVEYTAGIYRDLPAHSPGK